MSALVLSEITLSHFRSHKRAVMACDGRPVAIYGANGAGKTNLLEAVSLLSPGRGLRRASPDDLIRRPESLGWKITAQLQSLQQSHEIATWAEPGSSRQVRIDDKATAQVALGRIGRVLWLVPSMDRLWIEGAEGRRRFLDRATLSFEPTHAEAVLSYEKAMRERNRLLKDMVRDPHWYVAIERQMAEAGARVTTSSGQSNPIEIAGNGAEIAISGEVRSSSGEATAVAIDGDDALRRLEHFRAHGPSDEGFPLGRKIPPPPRGPAMTDLPSALIPYLTVADGRAALE